MSSFLTSQQRADYERVLAERLTEMSLLENQGEGLRKRDFYLLLGVTIIVPAVALLVGWTL